MRRTWRRGDLRRKPGGCDLDAFERVAAVDMPDYVFLAAGIAAAGPTDLFETADGFGREGVGTLLLLLL